MKRQLFNSKLLPPMLNRRFFPHRRDYKNVIDRARLEAMRSLVDQDNLKLKTADWPRRGQVILSGGLRLSLIHI